MYRRRDEDPEQFADIGPLGTVLRRSQRANPFWSPDDALMRQPFAGFPGGREAWMAYRQGGPAPSGLSPQQRSFYYRRKGSDFDEYGMPTSGIPGPVADEPLPIDGMKFNLQGEMGGGAPGPQQLRNSAPSGPSIPGNTIGALGFQNVGRPAPVRAPVGGWTRRRW